MSDSIAIIRARYRQKHAERLRAESLERYWEHPEKSRSARRARYAENVERSRGRSRKNYHLHREKRRSQASLWKRQNAARNLLYMKQWRLKNKAHTLHYQHGYFQRNKSTLIAKKCHRLKTDPQEHLRHVLRCKVNKMLRRAGASKAHRTMELIGLTVLELRNYLTVRFLPGMAWSNYGPVWNIDHIRPCASFDLKDPEQQRQCFRASNLRPLWSVENSSKRDKIL